MTRQLSLDLQGNLEALGQWGLLQQHLNVWNVGFQFHVPCPEAEIWTRRWILQRESSKAKSFSVVVHVGLGVGVMDQEGLQ